MKIPLGLFGLLCAGLAQAQTAQTAQTAYRWVDQEGKTHYGDRPPPPKAAREIQERKLTAPTASRNLPYALRQAVENFPVTLYVSANCGASCKESRDYLNQRGIPFTEKAISTNEEADALKKLLGEDAVVPVLQVGTKTHKGFLAAGWAGLLDAAGYPQAVAR